MKADIADRRSLATLHDLVGAGLEQALQPAPAMRLATVMLLLAPALAADRAFACPETAPTEVSTDTGPSTLSPCFRDVDFTRVQRAFEVRYTIGAVGTTQTGVGNAGSAFAALELAYGLQFGGDGPQPAYEVEVSAGAAVQRSAGDVSATGLVTRGGARLGPAQVAERVVDDGTANIGFFPLSMEVAHVGEVAARPRLAARPELGRSLYSRERITLATRMLRVEGAGERASTTAPGLTEVKKPSSWAFDLFPLHSGLDVAMQDATRFETTIGGAFFGVIEHTTGATLELLGIEHRRIDLPMTDATSLDTLWVLRIDGVDPHTGTQYFAGWGAAIAMPDREELAKRLDPENGDVTIGGLGWFAHRAWGGFGMQYKREPYATMTGAAGLEDRVSGEVYVPRLLGLVARAFAARTTRLIADELRHDNTAGIALDATYARNGWSSKLGLELGRTFYSALDNALPETTGFAAQLALTVQHTGGRAWIR